MPVDSFKSPAAKGQSKTADSEAFPTGGTRGQAMPEVGEAGDQGVAMPKGTVTQLTNTARKALPKLPQVIQPPKTRQC